MLNDVIAEDVVSAAQFFANQDVGNGISAPVEEICLV